MTKSRVLIGGRFLWLAWYPLRGRRCDFGWTTSHTQNRRWHLQIAIGPAYASIGPGVPFA